MKKILIAFLTTILFVPYVNAAEYNPYIASRISYIHVNNDANQWVEDRGYKSTIVNETLNDETTGAKIAVGVEVPLCGGLAKSVRAEVEYSAFDDTHNSGSYGHNINGFVIPTQYQLESKIRSVMLNVYYDLDTNTRLTPYINVGVGYANIKEKAGVSNQYAVETAEDKEDNFAWNVGIGASYALSGDFSVEMGYRYTDYGNIKNSEVRGNYQSSAERDYNSHEILLGLRYTF